MVNVGIVFAIYLYSGMNKAELESPISGCLIAYVVNVTVSY